MRDVVSRTEGALSFFAQSFDPASWSTVRVKIGDGGRDVYVDASNFRELVRQMLDNRIMSRSDDDIVTPMLRRADGEDGEE